MAHAKQYDICTLLGHGETDELLHILPWKALPLVAFHHLCARLDLMHSKASPEA